MCYAGGLLLKLSMERVDLVCLRRLSGRTSYERYHGSALSNFALPKSNKMVGWIQGVGAKIAYLQRCGPRVADDHGSRISRPGSSNWTGRTYTNEALCRREKSIRIILDVVKLSLTR